MNPELHQKATEILYLALKIDPADRLSYLNQVCGGDSELREYVDKLIKSSENAHDFELPLIERAVAKIEDNELLEDERHDDERLKNGRIIAHYKIQRKLGDGGMGEVYLAEDLNLGRNVALKLLSDKYSSDQDYHKRLLREAKVASSLRHPNICTIFGVNLQNDTEPAFIAMDFVEGETLAEYINGKPLGLAKALQICLKIADAISEAHAHMIIHRDVKPLNIKFNERFEPILLDFGLAKQVFPTPDSGISPNITQDRCTLGTPTYMSPEQVNGLVLDERTDIWNLGVCLYEMISGKNPFSYDSQSETLEAVLRREPPFPETIFNARLKETIKKALKKDRTNRYQSMAEFITALKEIEQDINCPQCGTENNNNNFCKDCGYSLADSSATLSFSDSEQKTKLRNIIENTDFTPNLETITRRSVIFGSILFVSTIVLHLAASVFLTNGYIEKNNEALYLNLVQIAILFLISVLLFSPLGLPRKIRGEWTPASHEAFQEFLHGWTYVWITWLVVYFYLFVIFALRYSTDHFRIYNVAVQITVDFLNITNSFAFFYLFLVLDIQSVNTTESPDRKKELLRKGKNVAILCGIIFVMSAFFRVTANGDPTNATMMGAYISGMFVALAMAYFFGRLDSHYMKVPRWMLAPLYVYAIIQLVGPISVNYATELPSSVHIDSEQSDRLGQYLQYIFFFSVLLLKLYLFFIISYWLEHGQFANYFKSGTEIKKN